MGRPPLKPGRVVDVLWVEALALFVVSHLAGDFILQTDWQARYKRGGLGDDPRGRRALVGHMLTYTLAFVPAFVWLGTEIGALPVAVVPLVALPHLVQDDGRLLCAWMQRVKGVAEADDLIYLTVDRASTCWPCWEPRCLRQHDWT